MSLLRAWLFPKFNALLVVRLVLVAAGAFVVFKFVFPPVFLKGLSMEPTYQDGAFHFCNGFKYRFAEPERFDVVAIRLAGGRRMFLKRIVGLEGEEVAFKHGHLMVNGKPVEESYLVYECDWEMEPVLVKPGHVFVVGDNRSMPIDNHRFGQVSVERMIGGPLW